jgi:hypothetical protein
MSYCAVITDRKLRALEEHGLAVMLYFLASTLGSTALGFTAGISAGGAVMTAGTIKPPPHGRAD